MLGLIELLIVKVGGNLLSDLLEGDDDDKLDPSTQTLISDVTGIVFDKVGGLAQWFKDNGKDNPKDNRDCCVANKHKPCMFKPRQLSGLCVLHAGRSAADVNFSEYNQCAYLERKV